MMRTSINPPDGRLYARASCRRHCLCKIGWWLGIAGFKLTKSLTGAGENPPLAAVRFAIPVLERIVSRFIARISCDDGLRRTDSVALNPHAHRRLTKNARMCCEEGPGAWIIAPNRHPVCCCIRSVMQKAVDRSAATGAGQGRVRCPKLNERALRLIWSKRLCERFSAFIQTDYPMAPQPVR